MVVAELDGPENEALDLVPLITNTVLVIVDRLLHTGWAATCSEGFVNNYSESSPGRWALLQMP